MTTRPQHHDPASSDTGIFGSMIINDLEWLGERIMYEEDATTRTEYWLAFEVSIRD